MNKNYLGQLQIEANVPIKNIFSDFINVTVDFEIICPNCGPKYQNIKKNGHDSKLIGNPQFFFCKTCLQSFFPHTSWIFKEFTNLIVENIIDQLFIENLSPKAVARNYDVSQSLISKIRYQCFDILAKKVAFLRSETENIQKLVQLPSVTQSGIWWDETFFKINGCSYFLILIIDALGNVLGYKFSKTRTEEDYLSILLPINDKLPEIPIFICDGNPTYEGVIKGLKRTCFLIQHIHSHPWKNAKIHYFRVDESKSKIEQTLIILPYDSFTKEENIELFAATKRIEIKNIAICCIV